MCEDCLLGKGGECHAPKCALHLSCRPDLSLRDNRSILACEKIGVI